MDQLAGEKGHHDGSAAGSFLCAPEASERRLSWASDRAQLPCSLRRVSRTRDRRCADVEGVGADGAQRDHSVPGDVRSMGRGPSRRGFVRSLRKGGGEHPGSRDVSKRADAPQDPQPGAPRSRSRTCASPCSGAESLGRHAEASVAPERSVRGRTDRGRLGGRRSLHLASPPSECTEEPHEPSCRALVRDVSRASEMAIRERSRSCSEDCPGRSDRDSTPSWRDAHGRVGSESPGCPRRHAAAR
jgi:hypothetical protein